MENKNIPQERLDKDINEIANYISSLGKTGNCRIANLETVMLSFNKDIASALLKVALYSTEDNYNMVSEMIAENGAFVSTSEDMLLVLSMVTKMVLESHTSIVIDKKDSVFKHLVDTLTLLRVNERAPFKFETTLEEFKVLRKFVRNNIRYNRPASDLSMHSVDARSALLQEIKKFTPFYANLKFHETDGVILDSKFRYYLIDLIGDETDIKNVKRLIKKFGTSRVEVSYADDKKIYAKTRKELLEINIKSYVRK